MREGTGFETSPFVIVPYFGPGFGTLHESVSLLWWPSP